MKVKSLVVCYSCPGNRVVAGLMLMSASVVRESRMYSRGTGEGRCGGSSLSEATCFAQDSREGAVRAEPTWKAF